MNAPLHREMPAGTLDAAAALSHTTRQWDNDIVQRLTDYIQIPAKSPGFDKDWAANGHLETVMRNAASLGRGAKGRRPDARNRAPAGPHAGAVLRGGGHPAAEQPDEC
jgi:hypothetical protein